MASTITSYAAIDTVATLPDLQGSIRTAMINRVTSYSINYTGSATTLKTDITNIINSIYSQYDYIKYTAKGYAYTATVSGGVITINFTFNYWNTAAQDAIVNTRVTEILGEIITPGMNAYAKQKAIHDWIVKNVAYDTTLVKYTDYDGLVSPFKTVCQGYALLSYKMLNQAGIETKIIEGTAKGQAHAWNLVKLDGVWYHFDATWDDPTPDVPNRATYSYYNLTDSQIKANHSWVLTYPSASTDFSSTLNTKLAEAKLAGDSVNESVYQGIITALELQYLTDQYTVKDATELNFKIQDAIKQNQTKITVRYLKGNTITTDLQTAIAGISNITAYSYSKYDYVRSAVLGDIVLDLNFTYLPTQNVSSISLSSSALTLPAGTTSTLITTVLPSNASNKTIMWTTSNPSVATVTSGIVKAVGDGTATITATTADGGKTATCSIKVIQGISSITLNRTTATLKVGDADITLIPTFNPDGATIKTLTWKSSNPAVATVDITGKVRAVAYGTTVISAISVQDPTKIAKCTITVPIPVTGVTINTSSAYVKMGTTLPLTAVIAPATATIKTVIWTSSDITKARVSATGVVTPVTTGLVTITATTTDGGKTAAKLFNVVYSVAGITLNKTTATLKVNDADIKLISTISPANATINTLAWKSSNPAVATVNAGGTVHAVAYGTTIISATSVQDPTKIAKCTVTVPVPVTGVAINASTATVKMGSTLPLTAVIAPATATIKTVTWTSDDETIAKVSATGVVTPLKPGDVNITATSTTDATIKISKKLTVIYAVTSITLDKTSMYLKLSDSDITLNAAFNPTTTTNKALTWTSSNPAVATVNAGGIVHAVAYGTTVISATSVQDPTKIAKCTVTVPVPVTGVAINASTTTVKMGSTLPLTAVIAPATATIKTVTWTSDKPEIARVSTTGVVTPVAPGTATITATSTTDANIKASKGLTVIYAVTSITLDKTSMYLKLSDTPVKLTATINATASNKTIIWKSSNPTVATVDQNGIVTAETYGTAIISAISEQDSTKIARCTIIVPVPVIGVTINASTTTAKIGSPLSLSATIEPTNATIKAVTWTSSKPEIARVSTTGVVTPLIPGDVIITATADGNIKATINLTVIAPVTSITLDKTSTYLKVGADDITLAATVNPTTATVKTYTWASSNPAVATVGTDGKIHAVAYGTTVISATSVQDPAIVGRCTITVPVPVEGIAINSSSDTVKIASTLALTATINPTNATIKTVIWTSSKPEIARVGTTGIVTPVAPGTATITATTTDGNKSATKVLTVIYAVTSVTLDKTSVSLKVGAPDLNLVATVNPTTATDKTFTWTSSNPAVATVDATGKVHAVAVGTAVISATSIQDPTKAGKCTVTVPVPVTGVTLSKTEATMKAGTILSLACTIAPTNATIKTVTWSSDDISKAKVSSTGVVTALAAGTATITVSTNDGSFTAVCVITITN
jgi:uncharacterized protein YjdB